MKVFIYNIILFVVMFFVSLFFNSMNILAYNIKDIYISNTLLYSSLYMASTMIWAHELVHYLSMGVINYIVLFIGLFMSIFFSVIMRQQLYVDEKQWMKRMIGHHSTALTTTNQLIKKNISPEVFNFAKNIVSTQENEINKMKIYLKNN